MTLNRPSALSARALAHRRLEDRYTALRHSGVTADRAAEQLGLTPTSRHLFEEHWRAQTSGAGARDSSCPAYAEHDRHVAAVLRAGGFPVGTRAGPVGPDGKPWRAVA
jgi:hypothetical protein